MNMYLCIRYGKGSRYDAVNLNGGANALQIALRAQFLGGPAHSLESLDPAVMLSAVADGIVMVAAALRWPSLCGANRSSNGHLCVSAAAIAVSCLTCTGLVN